MLCPEVHRFPVPKVVASEVQYHNIDLVLRDLEINSFFRSVVITCPDEVNTPPAIEQDLLEDNEYYRIRNVSLKEFLEPAFIDNFVKNGKLYCLTTGNNCITQNCAAVTPNGILTLHILDYVFQTLGLEGIKRPRNFFEVKIDLKNIKNIEKVKISLDKLELFNFDISWEPDSEDICPSSIAKYFNDKGIQVSLCNLEVTRVNPTVTEVPSCRDVSLEEMTEWIGMLAQDADTSEKDTYISTFYQPESRFAMQSNRMSVLIVKGFFTSTILAKVCKSLLAFTWSREMLDYWTCVSIQSHSESLWQWSACTPKMFQSIDSSTNIFFTKIGNRIYNVGQIKYP